MEKVVQYLPLVGREIHGFNTSEDLDIAKLMAEACMRWLRPNEVHAILSNYTCFRVQPQPVDNPPSGTLLLFDRKMLRNFRKDGHNWRKKKDGKTVQEAHEKLKIGNEERIHVYYARSEDDPNFYRRCYWLLDRDLERIVLVHYRQTSEENAGQLSPTPINAGGTTKLMDSPLTPLNSVTGSNHSDASGSVVVSDEINSDNYDVYIGSDMPPPNRTAEHSSTKLTIDALDRLGWEDIMKDLSASNGKSTLVTANMVPQMLIEDTNRNIKPVGDGNKLQSESSFERWNVCLNSSPRSEDPHMQCLLSNEGQIFSIIDVSPSWAYLMEETKIILVGKFADSHTFLEGYKIFCMLGDICVPVESLKNGVYRIMVRPPECGTFQLFLTIDGHTPISQVINFECKAVSETPLSSGVTSPDDSGLHRDDDLKFLIRLCHLLFSTTKTLSALSARISPNCIRDAKKFSSQTSSVLEKNWMHLLYINEHVSSISSIRQLLETSLKNKLQEWILLNIVEGCRTTPRDAQGQGVIHLCSILDYAWAINLFALSNISLDLRDVSGWTALHWAAYYGREKTIVALLSAGANPSLVTDPTHDFPGGCTASDIASQQGYEGLGAYLAEKGLQAHFQAMKLTGNISSPSTSLSVDSMSSDVINSENISEQELCLKDSLAAYRNAADAADRIQAAFRERSHKQQMKAAQLEKHHAEAESIVAALKIQKAFRNYNRRKLMKAAARIQGTFRTWQARKNFLHMRRQVIKIQAVFRGHQIRKQYHKICWSVGVLEKAVLRWRLKRKGLRGLQAESPMTVAMVEEENCVEEDFYRISREQAEERVKRSVVRVQAMFRSYRAQQQYRRIKLAHNQAKLEFSDLNASRQQFNQ